MEKKPGIESKKESPEETVKRFVDFSINLGRDMWEGGVMWQTVIEKLFENMSGLEEELVEEYREKGLTGVKARFLEELYANKNETGAATLGGIRNLLERILSFE